MKKVVESHTLIDDSGTAWEAQVILPWIWRPGDPESYQEKAWKPGDPITVEILLNTPDDPDHYAYGENGARFSLSSWAVVAELARANLAAFESEAGER